MCFTEVYKYASISTYLIGIIIYLVTGRLYYIMINKIVVVCHWTGTPLVLYKIKEKLEEKVWK